MNGAPTITATAVDSPTDGREAGPVSPGLARLIATLADYLDAARIDEIIRAYHYAAAAHGCQTRRSGEPYITHPVAVGQILAEMHMDHHGIMAALLHDVLEDTSADEQELRTLFGDTVAELVDGVSKLQRMNFASQAEAQAENFLKMTMAMAKDIRVILVKLADRLHNMRTLGVLASAKRRRIARETLEIYAPIAHRLGMYEIRAELEDLGFQALYPMRARRIEAAVRKARGNRDEMLATLRQAIQARLEQTGLPCRVMGRERHLYSIYRKMREERKSFNKIMDVYAFRVIVDQVDSCYRPLGVLHGLYKPVPGRFRDYIAIPKGNGYQSL
ncbi:MAG: HD domain-containing protein, partial [Pseudomonadales bacterium]|nr:HD domain-containing protein [Pseudomonadales bacterium]